MTIEDRTCERRHQETLRLLYKIGTTAGAGRRLYDIKNNKAAGGDREHR